MRGERRVGTATILLVPAALLLAAAAAAQPVASVADRHVAEGDAGTTAMDFTITLSEASPDPVTVGYRIESFNELWGRGGADLGTDYVAEPEGVLIFEPGETSKIVPVAVMGDEVGEGDEGIIISLSDESGEDDHAYGVIVNDDQGGAELLGCSYDSCKVRFPIVSVFDPGTGTWQPGAGSLRVTAYFLYPWDEYWDLDWGWRRREYENRWYDPHFVVSSSGRVAATWGTWGWEAKSFWQCAEWDYDDDGAMDWGEVERTFEYGVACEPGGGIEEPCRFRISAGDYDDGLCWGDVDHLSGADLQRLGDFEYAEHGYVLGPATLVAEPRVAIADARSVAERGYVTFAVTLDKAGTERAVVSYATQDGTAVAGLDYVAATGTLVFEPGEKKKTVKIAIVKDVIREEDETFTLEVTSALGAGVWREAGTGTIVDDEVFTVTMPATVVGCLPVNVKITLPGAAPEGGVTVTLASGNPNVVVPASVFFKAGTLSKTIKAATVAVAAREPATVTAFMPGEVATDTVTLKPMGPKSQPGLVPNPVIGGASVAGTVTLQCPAGPGDVVVSISSSIPSVAVPATPAVTVPAGTQTWPFGVTTFVVDRQRLPTISVTANGISKGKTLTVNP